MSILSYKTGRLKMIKDNVADFYCLAAKFTNKTGEVSVRGKIVSISEGYADSVELTASSGVYHFYPVGIIYSDYVSDGLDIWVAIQGEMKVMVVDNEFCTQSDAAVVDTTDGKASCATPSNNPQTIGIFLQNYTIPPHSNALVPIYKR